MDGLGLNILSCTLAVKGVCEAVLTPQESQQTRLSGAGIIAGITGSTEHPWCPLGDAGGQGTTRCKKPAQTQSRPGHGLAAKACSDTDLKLLCRGRGTVFTRFTKAGASTGAASLTADLPRSPLVWAAALGCWHGCPLLRWHSALLSNLGCLRLRRHRC